MLWFPHLYSRRAIPCVLGMTIAVWIRQSRSELTGTTNPDIPSTSSDDLDLPVIIRWDNFKLNIDTVISCKTLQCRLTSNREVRHQHEIVGIWIYGDHFGYGGFPLPRKPGHLWSVLQTESPKNNFCQYCAKESMSLFNLTGTFKRESDYPVPTMWLPDPAVLTSTDYVVSIEMKNRFRKEGLAPIVFVHSDCDVPSDRDNYVRLLQQYIQIDSYGKCVHNIDFPEENMNGMGALQYTSQDFYKLLAKYKFAFAFENAICDDYITEKFWRPLHLGIVPLVFGSPKIKDFAPSDHSIIDIRDFRSVKEVAEYITFLDTHDEEYSQYLDFKRTGIKNENLKSILDQRDWGSGKTHMHYRNGFDCFVCEKLHELKRKKSSGESVGEWQGKHEHFSCPEPGAFDEEGRYINDAAESVWKAAYKRAPFYTGSVKYHIDENIDADHRTIQSYMNEMLKRDNKEKSEL